MKLVAWYVSWYLLVGILGFLSIRLLIWMAFWILGQDLWVLPNILADVGIIESFLPFIQWEKAENTKWAWFSRVCLLLSFICFGVYAYMAPEDVTQFSKDRMENLNDLYDFGVDYLEGKFEEDWKRNRLSNKSFDEIE